MLDRFECCNFQKTFFAGCLSLRLLLVAARCSATAGTLKLASLGANVWASVRVRNSRSLSEVTAGLAGVALALDQDGVVAGGRQQGELIERQHFAAGLGDSLTSPLGDAQGADSQLGNGQQTQVIGDGSNHDGDVVLGRFALLQQATYALQRDDWAMDPAHEQTLQDDFVELLVRTAVQETVQLKE